MNAGSDVETVEAAPGVAVGCDSVLAAGVTVTTDVPQTTLVLRSPPVQDRRPLSAHGDGRGCDG